MALAIKNFETLGYVTLVTPPSMMNPEKVSFAILDLEEEQKNQFALQLNTIFPNDNVTVFVYNSGAPVGWIREATLKAKYILANTIILLPYSLMLYAFGMGIVYTVIAAITGGLMLAYHYKLTKTPTSDFAWKAYKVTAPYLTIIFIGIALDAAFHFRF